MPARYALGAARNGDPTAAQKDVERIVALRDELKESNEYWANEVEVMRAASLAWVALAQKRSNDALALMRRAADVEDKSEKNIITPGRLLPARELLGDMLMELNRPAEALKEYEASQQREPNRYRGLYGAGQAAAQSGNRDKARQYFSKLIELAGLGDRRPETENARRFLAADHKRVAQRGGQALPISPLGGES
jgi:tetratricopeptide (TPR) repeat protein